MLPVVFDFDNSALAAYLHAEAFELLFQGGEDRLGVVGNRENAVAVRGMGVDADLLEKGDECVVVEPAPAS